MGRSEIKVFVGVDMAKAPAPYRRISTTLPPITPHTFPLILVRASRPGRV